MNTTRYSRSGTPSTWKRLLPCMIAFMATLAASPGHAVNIPSLPLQSGAAYPPANIMFILDDSGSMEWASMPHDVSSMSDLDDDITDKSYVKNTIYYNPATTYLPWIKADGTRFTGGTSYGSAYSHASLVGSGSGTIDLGASTQTYFVPKPGATDLSNSTQYDRYQILTNLKVMKQGATATQLLSSTGLARNSNDNPRWLYFNVTVPAGMDSLVVTTSGGSGDSDIYLREGNNDPTRSNNDCEADNGNTNETCTENNPGAGNWRIGLRADSDFSGVTLTVGVQTVAETEATPTGRTPAAERENFAIWYSYHRTRMKVAKAGASQAFSQLGENVRVGYDSIWNRSVFPIPVAGNDAGVFKGANRTTWFERMQAANGSDGTPLKGALQRTGTYFKDTAATGPWGPDAGANQISCRQNFAILTTDGYWNNDSGFTSVGDTDGTAGPSHTFGKKSFTYKVENPYYDNFVETTTKTRADTLADVAMEYWKNDLRPTLDDNVPDSTADPAFWQHMVTFGVSIGLQGRLSPDSYASIANGSKHWGDPTVGGTDVDRIDDLWHAAVNGRGTFVAAGNPTQFAQGLVDALATVEARLGSASNVTSNSTSFTADTRVYQASYVSGKWSGELAAYDASAAGVSATAAWLGSKGIPATGRKVFTWNGSMGGTFPTSGQVTLLDQSSRPLSPVTGADNAAYLKGDRSNERANGTGKLRDRGASVLGDIVNSSPIYVKDNETIFVGANDGMLHAFAAKDRNGAVGGAELFAYVPGGIDLVGLASLSDPQYTHKHFVDGPITVSTRVQTPNKNYLVGALGRGGKGVFGLDVTAPDSFGVGNVSWELSSGNNLGQVLGEPLVVTLNDGSKTPAVIFGNGINSTSGNAVLYVVNIATGAVIQEIDTGISGDNGLSAPRGWDNNGDGTVDYAYAGDRKGNLWKFDMTGATASVAFGGAPMFTTATGQPITAGLAIARDPATGKRWVFIGTGSFMTNGDLIDSTVQSMYGVIDEGSATITRSDLVARDIVVVGTVGIDEDGDGTVEADEKATRAVRGFEPATAMPVDKKGWYVDLDTPTAGERIVSRPQVRGGVLITASLIPPTEDSCEAGGSGYINAIDAFTGTSTSSPYFDANGDGKVDSKDTLAYGDGTVPVGSIDLGVGMPTLPTVIDKLLVVGGSKGALGSVTVNPQGGAARRVSWREILRD